MWIKNFIANFDKKLSLTEGFKLLKNLPPFFKVMIAIQAVLPFILVFLQFKMADLALDLSTNIFALTSSIQSIRSTEVDHFILKHKDLLITPFNTLQYSLNYLVIFIVVNFTALVFPLILFFLTINSKLKKQRISE